MKYSLLLVLTLFLFACGEAPGVGIQKAKYEKVTVAGESVERKIEDVNDSRHFADKRFVHVKGLDFPDYAKFAGWIGRNFEVTPVYKKGDKSWFFL